MVLNIRVKCFEVLDSARTLKDKAFLASTATTQACRLKIGNCEKSNAQSRTTEARCKRIGKIIQERYISSVASIFNMGKGRQLQVETRSITREVQRGSPNSSRTKHESSFSVLSLPKEYSRDSSSWRVLFTLVSLPGENCPVSRIFLPTFAPQYCLISNKELQGKNCGLLQDFWCFLSFSVCKEPPC